MRRLLISVFALLLMASSTTLALGNASVPDEQWFAPYDRSKGDLVGFNFSEGFEFQRLTTSLAPSYAQGIQVIKSDGSSNVAKICESAVDPNCSKANGFIYHAIFPVCSVSRALDCIDAVWAEVDGKKIEGVYKESIPAKPTTPYTSAGAINLITGSTPSVWQIPGVIHGGGKDTYVVNTLVAQGADSITTPVKFNTGGQFRAGISPVNLITGNYPSFVAGTEFPAGDEYRACATSGDNRCAQKQAFPKAVRFGLSVRMSQPPLGWLHGRVKGPVAAIEKIDGGVKVSISGEPVQVPAIAGNFDLNQYPPEFQKSHKEDGGKIVMQGKGGTVSNIGLDPGVSGGNNVVYEPSLSGTTSAIKILTGLVKDKSAAEPTIWKISTLPYFEDNLAGECVKRSQKLAGIVSTNSTTYSEGPPALDKKNQTLDYELASAHYTSRGEEFLGTYDLVLDASVARCIYGFVQTPTSATVSIVKNGEVEKVSTTTLVEKDGWLSLAAYGFTFSSPKISVKLSQPKALLTPKKSVKTTITCMSGLGKKKVTGTNPKCPKGYKLVK